MSRSLVLAGVAFAAAATALAQRIPEPVSLSGTVVNAATGSPVPHARVELQPNGGETTTDAAGAFRFPQLAPGDYLATASKVGFIPDDEHEGGYEISLNASRGNFALSLTPLSSIRGRITDDGGEPVEGVTVLAMQSNIEAGRRRNQVVREVETNDRGEYRIPLLRAGGYLVKAIGQSSQKVYYEGYDPSPAARESFAPVYFGGSPDAAAATVLPLRPGAEACADFSVTLQQGHNISGRITNFRSHSTADLQLSRGDEDLGVNRSSLELATGQFQIHGVLDGVYRLRVYQRIDEDQLLFAEQNVALGGRDVEGVVLTLGAATPLKGKVRVEGHWDKPGFPFSAVLEAQDSFLALRTDRGRRVSGEVADGGFEIPSVFPGKYWIAFAAGGGLYVSSARAGDTDLLATQELDVGLGAPPELDIVLRTDGGSISGSIAPEATRDAEVMVLLVPDSCDRPASVSLAAAGKFHFFGVAPGNYRLHAFKMPAKVEFGTPGALNALVKGGTPTEVKAGETANVQLQELSEEPR